NGLTVVCSGGLAVQLGMGAVRWRRSRGGLALDRLIAATIVAMPLIMPFYFEYELLMRAIPAMLRAREGLVSGDVPRWLVRAWVGLYVWMYINALMAEATRINGTVLLLAAVAGMMMARALRSTEDSGATMQSDDRGEVVPYAAPRLGAG